MCVCVKERERETERKVERDSEREKERERQRLRERDRDREREREYARVYIRGGQKKENGHTALIMMCTKRDASAKRMGTTLTLNFTQP